MSAAASNSLARRATKAMVETRAAQNQSGYQKYKQEQFHLTSPYRSVDLFGIAALAAAKIIFRAGKNERYRRQIPTVKFPVAQA